MVIRCIEIFKSRRHFKNWAYCSFSVKSRRRVRSKTDMDLKSRDNPLVVKLNSPEFMNIFTKEVLDLQNVFNKYKYEIRIAGGAVRDLLMGLIPHDLDFATTATPEQMKNMFTSENIRMINMNGEKHGTITARINDKENFEVTTLRIDVLTDGRHAEVEFTTDWKLDASRRDLTINSMFLGFDGSVYDYFFGYEDLQNCRVAFVGDTDIRVKEDYLRILRYFRFYGRIAKEPNNHEAKTLMVLKTNVAGLGNISGERVWVELKKILQGNFAGCLLKTMINIDVAKYIGLPSSVDTAALDEVLLRSEHYKLHPISYLVALLKDTNEVTILHSRLKFSAYERDLAYFLVEHRKDKLSPRPLLPYEKFVLNSKINRNVAIEYVREVLKYKGAEALLLLFNKWEIPHFPISGKILKEAGVPPGKMYGLVSNKLKEIWIDNEYKHTVEELVNFIPNILKVMSLRKK